MARAALKAAAAIAVLTLALLGAAARGEGEARGRGSGVIAPEVRGENCGRGVAAMSGRGRGSVGRKSAFAFIPLP